MRVGLMSDSHDNETRLKAALVLFAREEVECILHMGDLSSVTCVHLFDGWRVWIARGNTDDPHDEMDATVALFDDIQYGVVHEVELDGVRIGFQHGDDAARLAGMINARAFDLVCHGHTHVFRDELVGTTRVVNPGAIHRSQEPSVCVFDTGTRRLVRFVL